MNGTSIFHYRGSEKLRGAPPRIWQRISYFYRGIGLWRTLLVVARNAVAPIYRWEVAYVVIHYIDRQSPRVPGDRVVDKNGTDCIVIESVEELDNIRDETPAGIPMKRLRRHLSDLPNSLVLLARRPTDTGRKTIAYETCQRGYFTAMWREIIRGEIPSDIIFLSDVEVLPKYRGQRIWRVMTETLYDYCRVHGISSACATVSSHNKPSLKKYRHVKGQSGRRSIVGELKLRSVLKGLYAWTTPWEEVLELINTPRDGAGSTSNQQFSL